MLRYVFSHPLFNFILTPILQIVIILIFPKKETKFRETEYFTQDHTTCIILICDYMLLKRDPYCLESYLNRLQVHICLTVLLSHCIHKCLRKVPHFQIGITLAANCIADGNPSWEVVELDPHGPLPHPPSNQDQPL